MKLSTMKLITVSSQNDLIKLFVAIRVSYMLQQALDTLMLDVLRYDQTLIPTLSEENKWEGVSFSNGQGATV